MTTNSLTALITGGTNGIGRAAANKLAQLGIHVIVVGRNAERGEESYIWGLKIGGLKEWLTRPILQIQRILSSNFSQQDDF